MSRYFATCEEKKKRYNNLFYLKFNNCLICQFSFKFITVKIEIKMKRNK